MLQVDRHLVPIQAARLGEGSSCGTETMGSFSCADGLDCRCFVKNRGLHLCLQPSWPFADNPDGASLSAQWERQGVGCQSRLPAGAEPLAQTPPLVDTGGRVVDPRDDELASSALREWASDVGPGRGFYSRYTAVLSASNPQVGISVLAGDDVAAEAVGRHAETARHLLFEAAASDATVTALTSAGVRLLIGGRSVGGSFSVWKRHPEVSKDFTTGLGGGAPWFPSTGITLEEHANILAEELFHTIQYTAMSPRQVCSYHNAYAAAVSSGLYTTDRSGDEVDGEPVPTLQADEYLAMAMQRWFGATEPPDEYFVKGNDETASGRQHLRALDPSAFCLLTQVFRSDDTWNPEPEAAPWDRFPNLAMDHDQAMAECRPILATLARGCPAEDVTF